MQHEELKKEVYSFWNQAPCGTPAAKEAKDTLAYFEEIEAHRYQAESQIFQFAQFTRYHGKKVLEVGVGAGSDFTQWVRAGAEAHGIDLTDEGVRMVSHRLSLYGLTPASLQVADAENIPHPDNNFDLVYSWGVIHHSPNTMKCLDELIRVTKSGGSIKFMVYNRHSIFVYWQWMKFALKRGRPWKSSLG